MKSREIHENGKFSSLSDVTIRQQFLKDLEFLCQLRLCPHSRSPVRFMFLTYIQMTLLQESWNRLIKISFSLNHNKTELNYVESLINDVIEKEKFLMNFRSCKFSFLVSFIHTYKSYYFKAVKNVKFVIFKIKNIFIYIL